MIINHQIKGSMETSFHNLQIQVSNMNITILNGSYFQNGVEVFAMYTNTVISIPSSTDLIYYEVWITKNGLSVLTRKENEHFAYEQLVNQIDRICWFSVPANFYNLNEVDIHFIKVVG